MEAPLSRVEAILQNILGADNVLVPPGSQVEEILQAIYYNTEYEKNPKSRVAEILLAIKNKGIYDGPVLSRVEDILVHKLNNIPYTKHKKEDLSRVEQLLLDWLEQGGGEEIIEYTGTFPMTILANGEPLLDYLISGNTVQSGTPTTDSPIVPQGTGERTGNLFDKTNETIGKYMLSDGTIASAQSYSLTDYIPIIEERSYTISAVTNQSSAAYHCFYTEDKVFISSINCEMAPRTFTTPANAKYIRCSYRIVSNPNIMLNEGSTPFPYEPYGYKIPISSANTTTPVYLGEIESTRLIKKLVLTGEETWVYESAYTRLYTAFPNSLLLGVRATPAFCTHFQVISDGRPLADVPYNSMYSNTVNMMWFFKTEYTDVENWKAYLAAQYAAGTPVTVWYVLATPKTAVVNEPLMKIGDYADTVSMEQAGADVPTNEKPTETVIDVSTSVKPSEGYIKYTEPSDGPAPKTPVLGTKDREIYVTPNNEVYILRR